MAEIKEVELSLVNQKLHFIGKCGSNAPIDMDYVPPLGDGLGYTGLELFLLSLAGCSGSTVLALLRRMKKTVSGFEVKAKGVRRDRHPTSFEKITLEFIVKSNNANDADIENAIKLSEETFCPVWAMVKNNVDIDTVFKIIA